MADYVAVLQNKLKLLHEERERVLADNAADKSNKAFEQNLFKQELLDAKKQQNNQLNISRIEDDMRKHKARWKLEDDFDKMKIARINKEIKENSSNVNFIYEKREKEKLDREKARQAEKERLEKEADEWEKTKASRIRLAVGAFAGLNEVVALSTRIYRAETAVRTSALQGDYLGMQVAEKNKEATTMRGIGQILGGGIGLALTPILGPLAPVIGAAVGGGLGNFAEAEAARIQRRQEEEEIIKGLVKEYGELGPLAAQSAKLQMGEMFRKMNRANALEKELSGFVDTYDLAADIRNRVMVDPAKRVVSDNSSKQIEEIGKEFSPVNSLFVDSYEKAEKKKDVVMAEALDMISKMSGGGESISEQVRKGVYLVLSQSGIIKAAESVIKKIEENYTIGDLMDGFKSSVQRMNPIDNQIADKGSQGTIGKNIGLTPMLN